MSRNERTGWRDMTYSVWHRSLPWELSLVDLDWIERCDVCKQILGVLELARDEGHQDEKAAWVTQKVARALNVQGAVVLYTVGPGSSITRFRVRWLHPRETSAFTVYSPERWVDFLLSLRRCHPAQRTVPLPKDAWRGTPERCVTCGSEPTHRFPDGSPAYGCTHPATKALDEGSAAA